MLSVSNTDGPAFNTRRQTQKHLTLDTSIAQPSITLEGSPVPNPTPKSLTADRLETLLQMQKTDPFCKQITKHVHLMERHHNMKQTFSPMSEAFYINMS